MEPDAPTFSFGQNWKDYLQTVSEEEVNSATQDIQQWLGRDAAAGKTIIDIGSGSGIHSLAFYLLGAREIHSFDVDRYSVEATKTLWEKLGKPENWRVVHGSILDADFTQSLGQFDVVYSWGVLHHTGAMWQAIEKSFGLVRPGGKLWISLYAKGPRYAQDLELKTRYNAASDLRKRWMIYQRIGRRMLARARRLKNPFAWNVKKDRGMNAYHDIVDWFGGLPYEVASEDEVLRFGREHGFILERIQTQGEGACSVYVFSLPAESQSRET